MKTEKANEQTQVCVADFNEAEMEELEKQWMQMSRETAEAIARNFGAPNAKYEDK